jgi:hypothetical protein
MTKYEWEENENGNYVYIMGSDDIMTVFQHGGQWFGVYDNCFSPKGFWELKEALEYMDRAVLEGHPDMLIEHRPAPSNTTWRRTNKGGYQRRVNGHDLVVKRATSGSWYIVRDTVLVKARWFKSAEAAMRQGDQML